MAILAGLLAGIVIQVFRFFIEWPTLFGFDEKTWVNVDPLIASGLVLYGAFSLGLFFQFIVKSAPGMGLPHVIDRVTHYHGRFSIKPAILQFFTAAWCILTGQSSGREGPAIHLGAATSSLLGQYLKLPSNSIRILAGCGTAAAIAASFNTPIAGIIFAMEVVLMEYTVVGFIPIILAACSGTLISRWVYGTDPAFIVPELQAHGLAEIPVYLLIGIVAGCLSAAFCFIFKQCLKFNGLPVFIRFGIAGIVTALLGYFIPELLGIGYFNVDNALTHQLGFNLLLAIVLAKLLASCVSQGMGMPIGIIGPTLVAGACLGSAILIVINGIFNNAVSDDSLYPMIAMGAMMAAVINAPLAALMALVELTHSTEVIFPAMMGIIVANLTCTQIFRQKPPHITRLELSGKGQNNSAFELALQRVGVSTLMNTALMPITADINKQQIDAIIKQKPRWLLLTDSEQTPILLNGLDFIAALSNENADILFNNDNLALLSLPLEHYPVVSINFHLSAFEAWEIMQSKQLQTLLVEGAFDDFADPVSGVITRQDFENYFHQPRCF